MFVNYKLLRLILQFCVLTVASSVNSNSYADNFLYDASEIIGTWKLKRLNGKPVQYTSTAIFEFNGEIHGDAACNGYGGHYQVTEGKQLHIYDVGVTDIACFPDEVMQQEGEFLDALLSTKSFKRKIGRYGERLIIFGENNTRMVFKRYY